MKKKNIFIYLMASSLLLSGAVMTSCESMIEEKPFDFIVPEDVEDSDNGADMWVTGVYNTLHEAMFRYGSFPRPLDLTVTIFPVQYGSSASLEAVTSREVTDRPMYFGPECTR